MWLWHLALAGRGEKSRLRLLTQSTDLILEVHSLSIAVPYQGRQLHNYFQYLDLVL